MALWRLYYHLVVSIPPKLSIADFVKNIKGSSAHYFNNNFEHNPKFNWQEGYGIFSLGRKQLEQIATYVNNQKEHHQQQTIIPSLEKTHDDDNPPSREYIVPSTN